jgi:hypothetical protein
MLASSLKTRNEGTSIETNFPEIINYKHTLYSTELMIPISGRSAFLASESRMQTWRPFTPRSDTA